MPLACLATPRPQDWDTQQKEKRERLLAGWKPEDEEEEAKDSGGAGVRVLPQLACAASRLCGRS